MITVYRYINGVCLNPREYLLDEQGDVLDFESESQAREFMGISQDEDTNEMGIYFSDEGE